MKRYRQTLLAGVAGLALIATGGLASAQEQSKDHTGGSQMSQPHAAQPGGAGGGVQAQDREGMQKKDQGTPKQSAQGPNTSSQPNKGTEPVTGSNAKPGTNGQQAEKTDRNNNAARPNGQDAQRMNRDTKRNTAENRENRRHGRQSTAQEKRGLRGLQGNASGQMQNKGGENKGAENKPETSGANVQLSSEQKTTIRKSVIEAHGAPRVDHVDFNVSIGTVVPRGRIHAVPVPETLVQIEPSWRGLLYFIYSDEIVVVDPHDMRIVAVLEA